MWANFGFLAIKNSSRKGVEQSVPKITKNGSAGPKSPSMSPSTKPNTTTTKICTKKNKIITEVSIEKIVFHGEDFCDRNKLCGGGESLVCGTPCMIFPDDE